MEVDGSEVMNEEALVKKHRQERKDLQAKIQTLKKTATKGRKKKELYEEIVKLQQELDKKQNAEMEGISSQTQNNCVATNMQGIENEIEDNLENSEDHPVPTKITRAQKRRNKKAEENKERDRRISEQEVKNKEGPRVLELNAIKELLKNIGLDLFNIPADGNCLYCAVKHQLEVTGREVIDVKTLRKLTANFMRDHKDDFIPFMHSDSDEAIDENQFYDYCKSVESTKLWGSQLELRALSNILECPIKIIQSVGQPTIQGENFSGLPLVITYHRHLYRLGEHYNSTVTIEKDDE